MMLDVQLFLQLELELHRNTAYLNYKDQLCWEIINVHSSSLKVSVTFVSFLIRIYLSTNFRKNLKYVIS